MMARPRKAAEHGAARSTLELVSEAVQTLERSVDAGLDVRPIVAGAIATLAVKLDALEAMIGELRGTDLEPVERVSSPSGKIDDARVAELEARIDEAGRRMLFASERRPGGMTPAPHWIADVGRALLFDTETPDEPVEATAAVEGKAEVHRLGEDSTA